MYNSKKKSIVKWIIFSIVLISVILINVINSIAANDNVKTSYVGFLEHVTLGGKFLINHDDLAGVNRQGLFCAQSGTKLEHDNLTEKDKTYQYNNAITIIGNYSKAAIYNSQTKKIEYKERKNTIENGKLAYIMCYNDGAFKPFKKKDGTYINHAYSISQGCLWRLVNNWVTSTGYLSAKLWATGNDGTSSLEEINSKEYQNSMKESIDKRIAAATDYANYLNEIKNINYTNDNKYKVVQYSRNTSKDTTKHYLRFW